MSRPLAALVIAAALAPACSRPAPPPSRLAIAFPRGLPSLDLYDPGHESVSSSILANVYEALVELGPDLTPRPGLAVSWHSPDPLTWVFQMRPGVRFHDGRPLTSGDVVAALERSRRDGWTRGELEPVVQVEARGAEEVVFRTREPFEGLLARLTYVLIDGGAVPGGVAPGTGPYRIRSWRPGGPLLLEAFEGYWGGAPPIREVEFREVPEAAARARAVESGEVQLASDVSPDDMARLASRPGLRTVGRPGLRLVFLALDCARKRSPHVAPAGNPLRDPRVREALDLAFDREALAAGPWRGYAEPAWQLPAPGDTGFDATLPAPRHDPARARRLLAEAGHPRGFELTVDTMQGVGEPVFGALAAQAAEAGIRLRLRSAAPREFLERVEARDVSAYLLRWTGESGTAQDSYASLLHTRRGELGYMNGGGWSEPRFDALLERVAGLRAHEKRAPLLLEATRLVAQERPILPLYRLHDLFAFSDRLEFDPRRQRTVRVAELRFRR